MLQDMFSSLATNTLLRPWYYICLSLTHSRSVCCVAQRAAGFSELSPSLM